MKTRGWIYIIVNKAMKGLIKIGYSNQDPIFRAMDLDNTGAPTKYQVAYDALVDNPYEFEQEMHKLLKDEGVGKEWFKYRISTAIGEIREYCPRIYAEKLDVDLVTKDNELWGDMARRYKAKNTSVNSKKPIPDTKKERLGESHEALLRMKEIYKKMMEPPSPPDPWIGQEQVVTMPDYLLDYREKHKEICKKKDERRAEAFEIWQKMTKEEQTQKLIELMQNMTPEIWRSNDHQISYLLQLNGEIDCGDLTELEKLYPDGSGLIDSESCNTLWLEIIRILEISLQKALLKGKKDSNKSD